MIGRPQPEVQIDELRAVVVHVRALDREKSRPASRAHIWAYAAFLVILLGSVRAETPRAYLPSSLNPIEESRMRTLQSLGVVSSFAIASVATAQSAVQWRVEDGGNGHWYSLVVPATRVTSSAAVSAAHAMGGALVSIGSEQENQFIFQIAVANPSLWTLAWPGATQITGPWLGATYAGGAWAWMDGTAWSFARWAPGEPNYLSTETTVLFMGPAGGAPTNQWNNIHPSYPNWGFMVEWSADCNGDGAIDYGQILSGELADLDANNIPDCCEGGTSCNCVGDTNNDHRVDGADITFILTGWGQSAAKFPSADCNHDGLIDGSDLAEVLNGWGPCH